MHLRSAPDAVIAGLKTIVETTRLFIDALAVDGSVDGIFYAVQHAQLGLLSVGEYRRFGRPFDLDVLESTRSLWLNMLHLHGTDVTFDQFTDYPIQVINWHDREISPTLMEALQSYQGAVCGGLRRDQTMLLGSPKDVKTEARQAIESTGGRRFILGTGCVTMTTTPYGNYQAARTVVNDR